MSAALVKMQRVQEALAYHSASLGAILVAKMATSMIRDPDLKGMRAIEESSGLALSTVFKHLPADQELAYGLIRCVDRGSDNTYEDQQVGVYSVVGKVPHACARSSEDPLSSSVLNSWVTRAHEEEKTGVRSLTDVLMEGRERLLKEAVFDALDPGRDIWASRQAKMERFDCRPAGHRGWALAVLVGCADVSLTLGQIGEVLGICSKSVYNLVRQLEDACLAITRKVGKYVVVDLLFESMLIGELVPDTDRAERKTHKSELHQHEYTLLKSRRTRHGRAAWLLIRFPRLSWTKEARKLYSRRNELKVAAMFEKSMNRKFSLAC